MSAPDTQLLQQLLKAGEPTLLERYRADPAGVRAEVEQEARKARAQDIGQFLVRLFR